MWGCECGFGRVNEDVSVSVFERVVGGASEKRNGEEYGHLNAASKQKSSLKHSSRAACLLTLCPHVMSSALATPKKSANVRPGHTNQEYLKNEHHYSNNPDSEIEGTRDAQKVRDAREG